MLKKRYYKPLNTTNQALMSDPFTSLSSPTSNKPLASLPFTLSLRVFAGFAPKVYSDHNGCTVSPTSILETKPFTGFTTTTPNPPFLNDRTSSAVPVRKPFVESTTHLQQPVGLGIVDELKKPAKPDSSRMVLFGSQLKIQIPTMPPNSPVEFGVKTRRNSHVGCRVSPDWKSTACLSASEMELSEDYTCVIAQGPNPRTIHIFESCTVESCGDGFVAVTPRQENRVSDGLLTSCDACKMKLGEGNDIFIYKSSGYEEKTTQGGGVDVKALGVLGVHCFVLITLLHALLLVF